MKSMLKLGGKQIVVTHPDDTTLKMEDGVLSTEFAERSLEHQLTTGLQHEGILWGEAVAWATAQMGIEACPKCVERKVILNKAKQLGLKETFRQIKETFRGSK